MDVWLVEMEDYIHGAKVRRHLAVELTQSFLKGYAATWWRTMKQEEGKTMGTLGISLGNVSSLNLSQGTSITSHAANSVTL
jgi:hypothetical protein